MIKNTIIKSSKMDIESTIRSSLFGELNHHFKEYPSFIRPLIGMILGAMVMQFFKILFN